MLFVQLGDLHGLVYFGDVDSLAVLLLIGTSLNVSFDKRIFPMERRFFPLRSRPVTNISECTEPPDVTAVLQSDSDAESITKDQ